MKQILIIEDNSDLAYGLRNNLEIEGYAITVAGDEIDLTTPETVTVPEHVQAAAAAALDRGETHYTTRPGVIPLREAIAQRLTAKYGNDGYVLTRAVVPPQELSPDGAVVRIEATSEPAAGSVRPKQASFSPRACGTR